MKDINYVAGKQDGHSTALYENGSVKFEGDFKNNFLDFYKLPKFFYEIVQQAFQFTPNGNMNIMEYFPQN